MGMCRLTTCSKCHRPTYAGCGAHVEQVLAHVPRSERCKCRELAPPPDDSVVDRVKRLLGR